MDVTVYSALCLIRTLFDLRNSVLNIERCLLGLTFQKGPYYDEFLINQGLINQISLHTVSSGTVLVQNSK